MTKNRLIKKSQVFKVTTLAFAGMLALTMFPTDVFTSSAQYVGDGLGFETIEVLGAKSTANKGEKYSIKAAYFGSDAKIPVGLDDTYYSGTYLSTISGVKYNGQQITEITSKVSVTYKPTGEVFEVATSAPEEEAGAAEAKLKKTTADATVAKDIKDGKSVEWGTFQMDYAGEYGINYSITISYGDEQKETFSTEYVVTSKIDSAYFEFESNDPVVLPTVYDTKLAKELLTTDKNVYLPLPTLHGKDIDIDYKKENIALNEDKTSVKEKDFYVKITATGANGETIPVASTTVTIDDKAETRYMIESKYLDPDDELFAGQGTYTIKYSYYVGDDVFVTSTTKTFVLNAQDDGYYKDYKYTLALDSTWQSSANTNVKQTLPSISASSADANHPKESVAIRYEIEARRQTASGEYDDIKKLTGREFTPWADGYYRIIYTATDFYGKKETLQREIQNVRDAQPPVPVVYDAANKENYQESDLTKGLKKPEELKDASSLLKSKAEEKNIIIYAINAQDNVPEGVVLSRSIRNSGVEIVLDDKEDATKNYAAYNLIFDFDANSFVAKNKTVEKMMDAENWGKDDENKRTNETELKSWLKAHNYLIVVRPPEEGAAHKTIEEGYAEIDVKFSSTTMLPGSVGGITYSVYYTAVDAAKNENTPLIKYDVVVVTGDLGDTAGPVINFETQLKTSYRKGSVIVFNAPYATDDSDTRMDVITQYYYVGKSSSGSEENYETREFKDGEYKIDLSEIDEYLTKENGLPTKVVITVSATDDSGNVSEPWKKEIAIVDVQDTQAPVLFTEKINTPTDKVIEQNSDSDNSIVLPTISLVDDNVDYINAHIYASRVDAENQRTTLKVAGKTETRIGDTYTLNAGKIPASYPGTYEVEIVFVDAGDNQISTFYRYQVEGKAGFSSLEVAGIDDQLNDGEPVQTGTAVELQVPTIDYTLDAGYGIFGVNADDSHTAYDYDIGFFEEPEAKYAFNDTEENTFTALQPGTFLLEYKVRVSTFDNTKFNIFTENNIPQAVVEKAHPENIVVREVLDELTDQQGKMLIYTNPADNGASTITVKVGILDSATGKIKLYKFNDNTFKKDASLKKLYIENGDSNERYYLQIGNTISFVTRDGKKSATFEKSATENKMTFTFVDSTKDTPSTTTKEYDVTPESEELDNKAFQSHVLTKSPVYLKAIDTTEPVLLTEYDYPTTLAKGTTWTIKNIQASDNSSDGIKKSASYIRVTHTLGDDSNFTTYNLSEYQGDITYKFDEDGKYYIYYYVEDCYQNHIDAEYKITIGDCDPPTISVAAMFKDKYNIGDALTINIDDVENFKLWDAKSSRDVLVDNINIKLINVSNNNQPVTNEGDDATHLYSYTLKTAGSYKLVITTEDEAGWSVTQEVPFEVVTDENEGSEVYQTIGTVLIVVAALILGGVIAYFVISKVVKDRKAKGKAGAGKTKNKKK